MLSVIGVGFPRTGTMSLKLALERLCFGPCYHMIEVFDRSADISLWKQAAAGHGDWERLFAGFRSTSDAPGCYFWRELLETYPTARCILTVRDADSWYESFRDTAYEVITHPEKSPDDVHRSVQEMAQELILNLLLKGSFADRKRAIDVYERHNAAVQRDVDPGRLLVFRVEDGWPPLCEFLRTDIPAEPFPHINTRDEFRERFLAEQPQR